MSNIEGHSTSDIPVEPQSQATEAAMALMAASEVVATFHAWFEGEYQYFIGQGCEPNLARALAGAGYLTLFGSKVPLPEQPKG